MKISFTKQVTLDTFYTLVPLNWMLRIFNLSCVYRNSNQLKVSSSLFKSIIYVFVLGCVNIYFLLHKIKRLDDFKNTKSVKFSDSIQMIYLLGYFEYIVDLFYVYKYGRDRLLRYFKVFDQVDQILGMSYYGAIRKTILETLGLSLAIYLLSSAFDYVCWVDGYGWISPTLYSLDYFYFLLNMFTLFDGMSHIIQLEYRLKMIRDLLQQHCNTAVEFTEDDDKTWASRTGNGSKRLDSLKTLCFNRFIEVIGFDRCYLLLLEQTDYLNAMFGVRGLLFCINLVINMISLTNVAIRYFNGSMVSPLGTSRLPTLSTLGRLLNWIVVAFIMVHRCEQTYRQTEKILTIIDIVLVNQKNHSNGLKTTLMDFRNLLISRPIRFHAFHFFTMDYTLLVSFASVVVTYTAIMLQSLQ